MLGSALAFRGVVACGVGFLARLSARCVVVAWWRGGRDLGSVCLLSLVGGASVLYQCWRPSLEVRGRWRFCKGMAS